MLKSPEQQELRQLLKRVREIEIRSRKKAESLLSGGYRTVFKGSGIEFEEVREYTRGDDIRSIDWNVTARTNRLFVKKYREEREMAVMILVDNSLSQYFGSQRQYKKDLSIELSAVLALSAAKSKDKAGLLLFDDQIRRYIPPKKGKPHVLRIIRELLYSRPEKGGTDIAVALNYVNKLLKRRSYIFVISDFYDEDFWRPLQMAARRHDVVPVVLRDDMELSIPDMGVVPFRDAESGRVEFIDTGSSDFRKNVIGEARTRDENLKQMFLKKNMEPIFIKSGDNYIQQLMLYFKRRASRY